MKTILPALSKVRKALYADWALQVKQRDGWKCLLCGGEDNLTAHHWYVSDHHAHAARYCVDNGATLCYACHIRSLHQRADWVTVNTVMCAVMRSGEIAESLLQDLVESELSTTVLRLMWNGMRNRPNLVNFDNHTSEYVIKGNGVMFVTVEGDHPLAVVGNVITTSLADRHEVLVVTNTPKGYRYTVKELIDE